VLLGIYYQNRISTAQRFGMIGMLIALLTYLLGPIAQTLPYWFLILFTITALFVLNAKEKIKLLAGRLDNQELITLAIYLVLAGVILPLLSTVPIAPFIPVTPYQTWLAVVVITGMSYLGYLLQTYVFPERGLLLAGAIGGIYSSTATTVVLARQSRYQPQAAASFAAAITLATGAMYLRLLGVVAFFNLGIAVRLLPGFLGFALLGSALALLLEHHRPRTVPSTAAPPRRHPLELGTALLFAVAFITLAAVTHLVLAHYPTQGLARLSILVGFTDVDPFVLSLLQGGFPTSPRAVENAIMMATVSNNVLKAGCIAVLATRYTAIWAVSMLLFITATVVGYALWRV
jgi:uncharacterized membrane protein (DUF4010 family)